MGRRYEGRRDGDEEVFFRLEETVEVEGGCRCHVSVRQHGSAESLEAAFGCDGRLAGLSLDAGRHSHPFREVGEWANDATAGRKITRNLKKKKSCGLEKCTATQRLDTGGSLANNEHGVVGKRTMNA